MDNQQRESVREAEVDMKIEERVLNYMALLNADATRVAAKPEERSGHPAQAESAPDQVDLSPDAARLAEDEARRQRLDAIRQQLAAGSYNISGKDVADKMLNLLKG
ncbi:MAG: flagellar biosynthesis anti-sigma factor FlgM [Geobacteraceae bacterium GWC2_53_11]|nr:MAG: flagellar biosynthesis anti-sigma factor FlgM [Geobacteraceae bacterium GWC2_53_11]